VQAARQVAVGLRVWAVVVGGMVRVVLESDLGARRFADTRVRKWTRRATDFIAGVFFGLG
jgi:hypothetical protein